MRSALCALALILLLPNTMAVEETGPAADQDTTICDPVDVGGDPPYVRVYEECLPDATSTASK